MRLAELMIEAGLPAGILNVVNGDKEAVDAHPRRSGHQGRRLRRLVADRANTSIPAPPRNGKRAQCFGGAKNHMIIMPDADWTRRPTR